MSVELFPKSPPAEQQVRSKVQAFANEHIYPTILEDDANCRFRREIFDAGAKLGLASLLTPSQFAGGGATMAVYLAAIEEFAYASLSSAVTFSVDNLPQGAIVKFGSDDQKEQFLRPLGEGRWLGAFSLSEPQSGSDAAGLRLNAKKTEQGYVLNGNKCWCSTAGHADLYLVMARTAEHRTKGITAFLVSGNTKGLRFGKMEKKLGLNASPLGELVFEDCMIEEQRRLGKEGQGLEVALSQLDSGRLAIGASAIGVSRHALETTLAFRASQANTEDGMDGIFARHYAQLQAVKLLLLEAASQKDEGNKITLLAAQLKLLASDLAMAITTDCLQSIGPGSNSTRQHLERYFRDAKSLQIVEGTNQIQQLVIARHMNRNE